MIASPNTGSKRPDADVTVVDSGAEELKANPPRFSKPRRLQLESQSLALRKTCVVG